MTTHDDRHTQNRDGRTDSISDSHFPSIRVPIDRAALQDGPLTKELHGEIEVPIENEPTITLEYTTVLEIDLVEHSGEAADRV